MKYAPVIIPTLNRYEHLRKCVESLQSNRGVSETELFISVDYPPSTKYWRGYEEVLKYVRSGICGFKSVHIYYQTENLGPFSNGYFLINEVSKDNEAYIFSEDDNIFSIDFLVFINKCLEYFDSDKSVFAICGYSYPIMWSTEKSAMCLCDTLFSAWGYATWIEKYRDFERIEKEDIQKYLKKLSNALKLYKASKILFVEAVQIMTEKHYLALNEKGQLEHIDSVVSIYLSINSMRVLIPATSRVMNIGFDGSGLHCDKEDNFIDDKEISMFSSKICKIDLSKNNIDKSDRKRLDKYLNVKTKVKVKTWILWLLYILGFRFRKEK